MNLKHLTDKSLLAETKRLALHERKTTAEILHHIKEVEKRKLFSDLKCSSMMEFLTKELGYSESAAVRRLQSSRLLGDMPELEKKIIDGTLSLSNINKAAGFFKKEDIKDPIIKKEILKKIENQSARDCEKTLFSLKPEAPLPKETVRVVSSEIHQLKINVGEETLKLLEDVRAMLGLGAFNDLFMKTLAEETCENLRRRKFKLTNERNSSESDSRYVSNASKRQIYKRSNGVCENCGSLFLLQFDHREPFALGGKSSAENIRLLCFHCNQRARIVSKL